jgi:hypothetical protein
MAGGLEFLPAGEVEATTVGELVVGGALLGRERARAVGGAGNELD